MKFKTLKWELIESLQEPEIKNIVTREMASNTDIFGQITVRFHTKQVFKLHLYLLRIYLILKLG